MAQGQRQLGLGWQIFLLLMCVYAGSKLTAVYGTRLADALGADFDFGRPVIEVFFAAVVAIIGVFAYRGMRLFTRRGRKESPKV